MTPPRDHELVVFEKPPRASACVPGEVYRVSRVDGKFWFVRADSIASGFPRGVTVDRAAAMTAIWRPATAAEREASIK